MRNIGKQHPSPRRRTTALILTVLALLALALAACGDQADEPAAQGQAGGTDAAATASGEPAAGGETSDAAPADAALGLPPTATPAPTVPPVPGGRVVLWHSWAGGDGDALASALAALREVAPGLDVQTLFVAPDELPQAYADAVRAGGGPDLVATQNWWLNDLLAAGAVAPLDGALPPAKLDEFWPAALANFQRDGQTYGLPTAVETVALFYNRALLDPARLPATTDDLLALAQENPAQGAGIYANLYHVWWGFPAYGAELFDGAGRVVLDQGAGAAAFLAWLKALGATPGSYVDEDYGMLLDRFKKGEFAFLVDGPWATAELRDALGDNLAVAALPAGPSGPAQPWLSADGIFLNPNLAGEQQRAALYVADYLTKADSATRFAALAGRHPGNRRAELPADPILEGFAAQAASALPAPDLPEMDAVWGYAGDLLLKVLKGGVDPAAAVAETAALINDENGK